MTADDDLMPFLLAAMNWHEDHQWTAETLLATPEVAHYVTGWMRTGDGGVVSLVGDQPVGAAWWRTFTSDDQGYGYVADGVPEIGLAVLTPYRRAGLATALMVALIDRAVAEGIGALSLSVEDGNVAARALYEDLGFTKVRRVGDSDTLLLDLD